MTTETTIDALAYQQGKRRTVGALETFQAMIAWIDRKLSSLSVDGYSAVVAAAAVGMFFMAGGFSVLPTERPAVEAPPEPLAISHISITPQDAGGMEVWSSTALSITKPTTFRDSFHPRRLFRCQGREGRPAC